MHLSSSEFTKSNILVHYKYVNTLRQRLVHPWDKTLKHNLGYVVYAQQCNEECLELYVSETTQKLHKRSISKKEYSQHYLNSAFPP